MPRGRDPFSGMYDIKTNDGYWSHSEVRGRRYDPAPEAPLPPLPVMDTQTVKAVEAIGRYLNRSYQIRRDIAHLESGVENANVGIKVVLLDHPKLRRVYDAFVKSNAGETDDDWRKFASGIGPAKRVIRLVVDNTPPAEPEPKIKRVRVRLKTSRVRINPRGPK